MVQRAFVLVAGLLLHTFAIAQDDNGRVLREAMVEKAQALAESVNEPGPLDAMLGIDKVAELRYPLDDPERFNWQFWPTRRIGLTIEAMSASQKTLTHELLRTVLSSAGYLKVAHIMQLEEILEASDRAGFPRAVDHYKLSIFGEPSMDDAWAWRFEGHHVSLSVSVAADGVRVTPSFLGANPARVTAGPMTGLRVHGGVEDLARGLVNSLSSAERAVAIVSPSAPAEIASATIRKPREAWDDWMDTLQPEGVSVRRLNEMQRYWVGLILQEVIDNYRPTIAGMYHDAVDPASLSFVWMGSTEAGEPHYFRLQGEDFVYEYDNVQNGGNHVHAVWRDKSGDFGADILREHYRSAHLR